MKFIGQLFIAFFFIQILQGCKSNVAPITFDGGIIRQCNKKLTDVIVVDIFVKQLKHTIDNKNWIIVANNNDDMQVFEKQ